MAPDVLALATFPLAVAIGAAAWIGTLPIAAAAAAGVTWFLIFR